MASRVIVVKYDPAWVRLFEEIRDFVSPVLSDLAVTIEHVGSTSVPGLASKPIVDIDVMASSETDIHTAIQRLSTLGYVHEGDLGTTGREAFIPPVCKPWHHLYLCTADNEEYKRHILFRDFLRSHPGEAKLYGDLKMQLAQRFQNDRAAYMNGKSEFVNGILSKAGWKKCE